MHALLTCPLFHQFTAYVYYRPAFRLTGLLSDLAVILILSSYSLARVILTLPSLFSVHFRTLTQPLLRDSSPFFLLRVAHFLSV